MKKARYICIEGTEGVYKTTNTDALVKYLRDKGYSVLQTKEPGSSHAPITLALRQFMLDQQYNDQLTMASREFISQAIRSIHLEKVILPALKEYDFIVQDRGVLSGLAYGTGCGNDPEFLAMLATYVTDTSGIEVEDPGKLYDDVVYLIGDVNKGLKTALASKKEFAAGDAMELKGEKFLGSVSDNMKDMSKEFNTRIVSVDGKSREQVLADIVAALGL